MLDHYPTPIFPVPLGTSPPGAPTKAGTEKHITASAPATFLPKVMNPLPIVLKTLVSMMWKDSRHGLNPLACEQLCKSLLKTIHGDLHGHPTAAKLPTHYRRAMSELLSTAASLSVAQHFSPSYTVLKSEFNKFATLYKWESIWKGNGPDYVVCSPKNNTVYFLEVKGSWRSFPDKPPNFPKNKAQSLNAHMRHLPSGTVIPVSRHVLSYGQVAPGKHLAVHWYNHESVDTFEEQHHALTLITGLAQFTSELRAAGEKRAAEAVERGDLAAARRDLRPYPSFWQDRRGYQDPGWIKLVVERAAVALFCRIARWIHGGYPFSRNVNAANRFTSSEVIAMLYEELRATLIYCPKDIPGERLIFRLPTGISFWTHENSGVDDAWLSHRG